MRSASNKRRLIGGAELIFMLGALSLTAFGQEPHPADQTAPPPLKIITRLERSQLNEAKDSKARMKTTIELAEAHLANAETQTTAREYDKAAAEVGMYWALVEDALQYLKTIDRDNNNRRDLYKRLELSLRAQGPRLTIMRRTTPSAYAIWIKEIEDFARKGRTEALNSFYGNTVLRENTQPRVKPKEVKKPHEDLMTPKS